MRRLRKDVVSCFRATPALQAVMNLDLTGADGPWVWSQGHCHPAAIGVSTVGAADADGRIRAGIDFITCSQEHPSPWHWDLLRFLTGLQLARPDLGRKESAALASLCRDHYRATMLRAGEGETQHATRIYPQDIPLAAQALIEAAAEPGAESAHLRALVVGSGQRARLRRSARSVDDRSAQRRLVQALEAAWTTRGPTAESEVLDCARVSIDDDLGSARWLVLIREPCGDRSRQRVLRIDERPPSALAQVLPAIPFAPGISIAGAATVTLGRDPYHVLLPGICRPYVVRTLGHASTALLPDAYDADDLRAAVRLAATLIAGFHVRGVMVTGGSVAVIAARIATDVGRRDLTDAARGLASSARTAHRLLQRISP